MDEQHLISEIYLDPNGDAPRIYADWLDDNGRSELARLIRLQLEIAEIPSYDPRRDEYEGLYKRYMTDLPLRPALRKKLHLSFERGLLEAKIADSATLTRADLRDLGTLPTLKTLSDFERLPTSLLGELANCPNVERLRFGGTRQLTTEDWSGIVGLSHVECLSFAQGRENVTDEDVRQLSAMTQLRELDLNGTAITDAAVPHLAKLDELEVLRVARHWTTEGITDAGVAGLTGLKRLKELDLSQAQISEVGLASLTKLTRLEVLNLGGGEFGQFPVETLARLNKLRVLGLRSHSVNDAYVAELVKRLPRLRELDLDGTYVSKLKLAQILPKTKLKRLKLETSNDRREQREAGAFEEFCRERGIVVEWNEVDSME